MQTMTIQLLLTHCVTISIICLGVHLAFSEGMIFFRFGKVIKEIIRLIVGSVLFITRKGSLADICEKTDRIANQCIKPLFDCLICMSSVWTIIVGHYFFVWGDWTNFVFPVLIVCGFNVILDTFILGFRNGNIGL